MAGLVNCCIWESNKMNICIFKAVFRDGFRNIIIAGADFSYPDGKAYSKGTYLDSLYNKDSIKINTAIGTF